MHILYLIDSLVVGGAERSLAELAPHLIDRGITLDVAFLHDLPGLQEEIEAAGASLFSLAGPGGRLGWIRRTAALVSHRHPHLVHTTLFEADVAGRIAATLVGVPVVSSLVSMAWGPEGPSDPDVSRWKVRAARAVDAVTARRVVRFHAVTRHVARVVGRRLRIPAGRIDVVPRGRDPGRLGVRTRARRTGGRALFGLDDLTPLILAVARHESDKGVDVLLRSFPEVLRVAPTAKLAVAGREGRATPGLRSTAERLKLTDSVRFLGERSDVPELLCAADVFVLPSRSEGLPGALLEAMALEAPIVATDLPNVREAVAHRESAILVPPEAPDALAAAIVATLDDPGRSRVRARTARRVFLDRFSIERTADGMVAFYERALGRRPS